MSALSPSQIETVIAAGGSARAFSAASQTVQLANQYRKEKLQRNHAYEYLKGTMKNERERIQRWKQRLEDEDREHVAGPMKLHQQSVIGVLGIEALEPDFVNEQRQRQQKQASTVAGKNVGDHAYGLTSDLFTSVPQRKKDKATMMDTLKAIKARL